MRILSFSTVVASAIAASAAVYAGAVHSSATGAALTAQMGMGAGQMGMGPGWQGSGAMVRHHAAMMQGIPEPYRSMTNPLPRTVETLAHGAKVYAANCAVCHGARGLGEGPAGANLNPPPGDLAWLASRPIGQWDPFIYWTVAEGGAQFGSAMPAYKDSLSADEIWAVAAYIQARFPKEQE